MIRSATLSLRRILRPWLALVSLHRVQHDLVRVVLLIEAVALAPVVADGIGEDVAVPVEICRTDGSSDLWISLQPVFSILVPEVEGAVRACSAKCAVLWMKRDSVDTVDVADVPVGW
jgi:hypothetical protein